MISFKPIQWNQPVHFSASNRTIPIAAPFDQVSFSGKKPLHIGILSYDKPENSVELRRLYQVALQRGYQVDIINPAECFLLFDETGANVHLKGKSLDKLDALIPDADSYGRNTTDHYYFMATLKQFKAMGIYTVNEADTICQATDKLETHRILSEAHIPSVKTVFSHNPSEEQMDLISGESGFIVVKDLLGANGVGIFLSRSKARAIELLNTFKALGGEAIAQEYMSETQGTSYRFNVIGDKLINVFECHAPQGSFKSNISSGGIFKPCTDYTPKEAKMAIQAAKALRLDKAGVDIIRTKKGSVVLEVNSTPSLEWFDPLTDEDLGLPVINALYELIEQQASSRKLKNAA